MVWFYLAGDTPVWVKNPDFQSHYGLILSVQKDRTEACIFELSIPLWSDFIFLVQSFEIIRISLSIPLWSDFISEIKLPRKWIIDIPFNPTMVWFYHTTIRSQTNVKICFQSHYGLILSQKTGKIHCYPTIPLSIPLWSDFIRSIAVWRRT